MKNFTILEASVRRHVLAVLDAANLTYDIYAHTYLQHTITNPRCARHSADAIRVCPGRKL